MKDFLVLDTETTGLNPIDGAELLEISIINQNGDILLDTLIRPVNNTTWPKATAIHGITPEMVFADGIPTYQELVPKLIEILKGKDVVIYSASFDVQFLNEVLEQSTVHCAMLRFAEFYGEYNEATGEYKNKKLDFVARFVMHEWSGAAHRALADCQAALSVWRYLEALPKPYNYGIQ